MSSRVRTVSVFHFTCWNSNVSGFWQCTQGIQNRRWSPASNCRQIAPRRVVGVDDVRIRWS